MGGSSSNQVVVPPPPVTDLASTLDVDADIGKSTQTCAALGDNPFPLDKPVEVTVTPSQVNTIKSLSDQSWCIQNLSGVATLKTCIGSNPAQVWKMPTGDKLPDPPKRDPNWVDCSSHGVGCSNVTIANNLIYENQYKAAQTDFANLTAKVMGQGTIFLENAGE
jgi:hypothetical protein